MCKSLSLFILGVLLCFSSGGCAENPVTGEIEFNLFGSDIRSDVPLGQQWSSQIETQFGPAVENAAIQNYMNYVGQNIARVSHAPELEWHFKAIEHKSVNAFALPGGYIYITSGMLKKLVSEAQLAGVLAHEAIHVTARHTAVQMSGQIGTDIALAAVLPADISQGVMQATSVIRQLVLLKYSRDDERQADEYGLDYMVKAGYDPYGMVETMQMLEAENEVRPVEFLSSHPSPRNRAEFLRQEIQRRGYNIKDLRVGKEDYRSVVLEQLR